MDKLGADYYYGKNGKTQNYAEAMKWFRKAAGMGYAPSMLGIGYMYEKGQSVQKNDSEAVKWYRKAAELGEKNSQFNLGLCYYVGRGVAQDYKEAMKWMRKSADQGIPEAKTKLQKL